MSGPRISWKTAVLTTAGLTSLALVILEAPLGGMTPPARVAAIILVTAATLWMTEVVPLFVTSFIVLSLSLMWLQPVMETAGSTTAAREFLAPFFSDIVLLFLGGFVLSAALHRFQLDDRIARAILSRTGRSVPRLIFGIMAVTAALSMWLSNTATAATMLALCLPMIRSLPEDDPYRRALVLSIPFGANLGGLGTPIGSPPNAIAMQFMRQAGLAPKFWMWMLIGVPGVIVMLGLAWILLMVLFRGRTPEVALAPPEADSVMSWRSWLVVAVSVVTIAGWITTEWHGRTAGTVALIPLVLFFGCRLLSVADLRGLSWDVLLVVGGGGSLGVAIAVSGLDNWIVSHIPLRESSVFVVMAVFGTLAVVMSSVMSNTATANLLMPIALGLSVSDLTPVMIGTAFACSLAMPLPVSTPPNAMAFSSGEISTADLLRPGLLITVIGTALAFTTGYWWWDIVGLF